MNSRGRMRRGLSAGWLQGVALRLCRARHEAEITECLVVSIDACPDRATDRPCGDQMEQGGAPRIVDRPGLLTGQRQGVIPFIHLGDGDCFRTVARTCSGNGEGRSLCMKR